MNVVGAGMMDAVGLASLTADVRALVADADVGESITWLPRGTPSYNPASGLVSYNGASSTFTAFIANLTTREIASTQGAKVGDVKVLVLASDVPSAKVDDAFRRADGSQLSVYAVESSPIPTHNVLYARKV